MVWRWRPSWTRIINEYIRGRGRAGRAIYKEDGDGANRQEEKKKTSEEEDVQSVGVTEEDAGNV